MGHNDQDAQTDWPQAVLGDLAFALRRENLSKTAELIDDAIMMLEIELAAKRRTQIDERSRTSVPGLKLVK